MAQATNSTPGEIVLSGDLTGSATAPSLRPSGVTAGVYDIIKRIFVDSKGRVIQARSLTPEELDETYSELITHVPNATTSTYGKIKCGDRIITGNGYINVYIADPQYDRYGLVKVDNTSLKIDSSSFLTIDTSFLTKASTSTWGQVKLSDSNVSLYIENGTLFNMRTSPATDTRLGCVQLAVDGGFSLISGFLTVEDSVFGSASQSDYGLVELYSLDPNSAFEMLPDGTLNLKNASTSNQGLVKIGITDLGGLKGLQLSNGVISLDKAEGNTVYGVVHFVDNTFSNLYMETAPFTYSVPGRVEINPYVVPHLEVNQTKYGTPGPAVRVWEKELVVTPNEINSTTEVTLDFGVSNNFVINLVGDMTLKTPINYVVGGIYTIVFRQDGVGNRQLISIDSTFKTNQTITLSTGIYARDVATIVCAGSDKFYFMFSPGYL